MQFIYSFTTKRVKMSTRRVGAAPARKDLFKHVKPLQWDRSLMAVTWSGSFVTTETAGVSGLADYFLCATVHKATAMLSYIRSVQPQGVSQTAQRNNRWIGMHAFGGRKQVAPKMGIEKRTIKTAITVGKKNTKNCNHNTFLKFFPINR